MHWRSGGMVFPTNSMSGIVCSFVFILQKKKRWDRLSVFETSDEGGYHWILFQIARILRTKPTMCGRVGGTVTSNQHRFYGYGKTLELVAIFLTTIIFSSLHITLVTDWELLLLPKMRRFICIVVFSSQNYLCMAINQLSCIIFDNCYRSI